MKELFSRFIRSSFLLLLALFLTTHISHANEIHDNIDKVLNEEMTIDVFKGWVAEKVRGVEVELTGSTQENPKKAPWINTWSTADKNKPKGQYPLEYTLALLKEKPNKEQILLGIAEILLNEKASSNFGMLRMATFTYDKLEFLPYLTGTTPLLDHRYNINSTFLHTAGEYLALKIATHLLMQGEATARSVFVNVQENETYKNGDNVVNNDNAGQTALHRALRVYFTAPDKEGRSFEKLLKFTNLCLDNGYDLSLKDKDGKTVFHYLFYGVKEKSPYSSQEILQLLRVLIPKDADGAIRKLNDKDDQAVLALAQPYYSGVTASITGTEQEQILAILAGENPAPVKPPKDPGTPQGTGWSGTQKGIAAAAAVAAVAAYVGWRRYGPGMKRRFEAWRQKKQGQTGTAAQQALASDEDLEQAALSAE